MIVLVEFSAVWTLLTLTVMGKAQEVPFVINVHTGDEALFDCNRNNIFPDSHLIRHIDWLKVKQDSPICPTSTAVYISNWMMGDDKFTVQNQFRDRVEHINLTRLKIKDIEHKDCGTYLCEVNTKDSKSEVKFILNVTGEGKQKTTKPSTPLHTTLSSKGAMKSPGEQHSDVHAHSDISEDILLLLSVLVLLVLLILVVLVLQSGFLYLHSTISCIPLRKKHTFLTYTTHGDNYHNEQGGYLL